MKYFSVVSVVVLCIVGCNKQGKLLKERIDNADSVAINYFKGDGSMDTVVTVKIIRDKKGIAKLANFITSGSSIQMGNCGYDGSLHFFKMNQVVQDVDFRMNDETCRRFYYSLDGRQTAAPLSVEAKDFLLTINK
jgi:hypothetical protein